MISTISRETLSSARTILLQTLYFACILAAIKALTHLHAHITRLFERKPFPFLDLPPEIRTIVYHHHFTRYRTPGYLKQFREMAMLPDAILNVNRQVYEEASHALYSGFYFVARIPSMADPRGQEGSLRRKQHVLRHMKITVLEIRWPKFGWYASPETGERHGRSVMELKAKIETTCALLARFPNLRTVKIFFLMEEFLHPPRRLSPAKHRLPGLLRPLKLLRRANPGIVVVMPQGCPVTTAELAEQQRERSHLLDWQKENNEDLEESLEDWRLIGEELGRMDGGFGR